MLNWVEKGNHGNNKQLFTQSTNCRKINYAILTLYMFLQKRNRKVHMSGRMMVERMKDFVLVSLF